MRDLLLPLRTRFYAGPLGVRRLLDLHEFRYSYFCNKVNYAGEISVRMILCRSSLRLGRSVPLRHCRRWVQTQGMRRPAQRGARRRLHAQFAYATHNTQTQHTQRQHSDHFAYYLLYAGEHNYMTSWSPRGARRARRTRRRRMKRARSIHIIIQPNVALITQHNS